MLIRQKAGAAGQAAVLPAATEAPAMPPVNIPNVLGWLGTRALRNATEDELIAYADLAADAQAIAQRGAAVAHGIAHLVRADSDGLGAGDFRDAEDVSALLLHFGDAFGLVAGLLSISEQAEDHLRQRAAANAATVPRRGAQPRRE